MFRCPSDPTEATGFATAGGVNYPYSPISYAGNTNLLKRPLPELQAPASTVMCFEVQGYKAALGNVSEADSPASNGSLRSTGTIHFPFGKDNASGSRFYATGKIGGRNLKVLKGGGVHSSGSNYIAADGHAKWLRPEAVSGGGVAGRRNCAQDAGGACTDTDTANGNAGNDNAAGTESLKIGTASVTLTFSPR